MLADQTAVRKDLVLLDAEAAKVNVRAYLSRALRDDEPPNPAQAR